MDSSLTSDSSITCDCPISAPGASTIPSPALPSNQSAKLSRLYFQAGDDVLLLREVVAVEHPFVRGSTCWEEIASTLQKELPAKFATITARTLRERATNLMESFLNADAGQRKQSGTEEEFKVKQLLLESLRDIFCERELSKQAAVEARRKEKKDKESGEKLRQDALETLKRKRGRNDEHGHQTRRVNLIWKRFGNRSRS